MQSTQITARQFMRKASVRQRLDCGSTFIHKLVKQGRLTPIRLSPRMTVYDVAEVDALADAAIGNARSGKDGAQ